MPALDDVPDQDPPNGAGRIVLDTPGMKARVTEITGVSSGVVAMGGYRAYATAISSRSTCTTPCVVDLERGTHTLVFQSPDDEERRSTVEVEVKSKPNVFRLEVGREVYHRGLRAGGTAVLISGLSAASLGGIFLATSSMTSSSAYDSGSSTSSSLATGLLVGGLVGAAVGTFMLVAGRPDIQKGASTQFPVSDLAPKETQVGPATASQTW